MLIEIILVVLGILTLTLGIWNVVIGAYVWGGLFLLGGLWSLCLGVIYICQTLRLKKREKEQKKALEIIDFSDSSENQLIEVTNLEINKPENKDSQEIEKAVNFTNEVIPTSNIEDKDLEELDENTQLITDIDEIDRDVEILQDIVSSDSDSLNKN